MKLANLKIAILFLFCLPTVASFSQFASVGSIWHYNIGEGHPYRHFTTLESVKDTLVLGLNAKKLCSPNCNPMLVAQQQDTVFIFNWTKNEFSRFFYYGGKVGDTLYLGFQEKDSSEYKVVISKVDTILVNGDIHKTYYTENQSSVGYSGRFIEGIGYTNEFLPINHIRPAIYHNGLRCFNWNTVEQRFKDIACDSYDVGVSEFSDREQTELKIAPNPASSTIKVSISNPSNNNSIQLINSLGTVVYSSNLIESTHDIPISDFNSGIYFLRLEQVSGSETRKVIIE